MARQPKTLVVAPVWNEEGRIATTVSDLRSHWNGDILLVDDGSTDRCGEVARAAGCHVIRHESNLGVGAALRTGIGYARARGYEVVVIVSGAGKTPGAGIPDLLEPITERGFDFVQGSRYLRGRGRMGMPFHRHLGTLGYSFLFSFLLGRRVTDGSSGFRAIRLSVLGNPAFRLDQTWLDRYELEPYVYYKSVRLGYRVCETPVAIVYPKSGRYTKMRPFLDWWRITRPLVFLWLGIRS
jgi:dolichol-phosphate mannosyltransferase